LGSLAAGFELLTNAPAFRIFNFLVRRPGKQSRRFDTAAIEDIGTAMAVVNPRSNAELHDVRLRNAYVATLRTFCAAEAGHHPLSFEAILRISSPHPSEATDAMKRTVR